jgi:signal transduction histidine kinase
MDIRKRLTTQFLGIVAFLLFISLMAIYVSFAQARKEEFYDRLGRKATMVAQMLIDIEEIDTELLRKIERNNPVNLANEKIVIFNYQNEQIYSTDEDHFLDITDEWIQQVRLMSEIRLKQEDYEIVGQFYTGQFDRIVIFAAATDIFGFHKLQRLRTIMLIVFVFSLIFVYFAGYVFSIRALHPISTMVRQVNSIEANNLNTRLDEGNENDEIANLAKTFNKMLERLELAFRVQKNFIANASHELRTPLTIITGQLEVVLMKARTNSDYKQTLLLVLDEIKDLNNLSNKLLMLAQTSIDKGDLNFMPVRVDEIIWKCHKEILSRDAQNSIDIGFGEGIDDDSKLMVFGNEILLKTAIINLIDNACKYSDNHHAEVHLDASADELILKITDQGIGISEKEMSMIFQPFYRSKRVLNSSGHGVGLSLAEKIISLHNGNIQVTSKVGEGTVFQVILPVFSPKPEVNNFSSFTRNTSY